MDRLSQTTWGKNLEGVVRVVLLVPLLSACAARKPTQEPPAAMLDEARALAGKVRANLLAVLTAELARGGPAAAIEVCRVKAPEMAKSVSAQSGWQVRRASLRNRNPAAVPDAWERSVLERFDTERARGVDPAKLETWALVDEGGRKAMRWAQALQTQDLCLQCHGAPEKLAPEVKDKLASLYPADRAVGYETGQLRGGLFLTKALP